MKTKESSAPSKRLRSVPLLDPSTGTTSTKISSSSFSSLQRTRSSLQRSTSVSSRSKTLYCMDDSSIRSGASGSSGASFCSTFTADSGKQHQAKKLQHQHQQELLAQQQQREEEEEQQQQQQPHATSDMGTSGSADAAANSIESEDTSTAAAVMYQQHQRLWRAKQRQESFRRRSVRFNESSNQWHDSTITSDDLVLNWLQEEDYADFYESMVLAVSAITTVPEAEAEESCGHVLGRMFQACCGVDNSSGVCHSPGGKLAPNLIMNRDDKRKLKALFKATPDLLGLERSVSSWISQDRIDRRNALIEKIEDLQSCGWPDHETEARKLAEASIPMTRPSRMFARQVAMGITPPSSNSYSYASLFAPSKPMSSNKNKSSGTSKNSSRRKLARAKSAKDVLELPTPPVVPMSSLTTNTTTATTTSAAATATSSSSTTLPPSSSRTSQLRKSKSQRKLSRTKSSRQLTSSDSSTTLSSSSSTLNSSLNSSIHCESATPTRTSYLRSDSFKGLSRSVII